eukprot:CAMPEP_0171104140 /NCGR_PEP_ID=MMETSP0766_2-20121228/60087_1 /TAXON_ID=439317 /ORGANISM="Gambierdiscus australes, Strain CAWD 149" /LENGTH=434 /DNA_ID=CAMNT_0011564715 /DNA_START=39 /DNA_END=1343 /DNA_ORIENTATION=+
MATEATAPVPTQLLASWVAEEVKQFIAANSLDDSAKTKLEALSVEQQVDVISQDAANVRNMNAVVISRANRAQKEGAQLTSAGSQEFVGGLVTRFIEALSLDEKASNGLRSLPPKEQVAVMSRDMDGVSNPSGVVDSRVRKLLRGGGTSALALAGPGASMGWGGGKNMSVVNAPLPVDALQYLEEAYNAFVCQYHIDNRAQELVNQLSPLEKLEVISQGMENVYNPSGAIASRCTKVRERQVVLGPRAAVWVREVAQLFCQSHGIDTNSDAWQMLQKLPADKQFEVCSHSLAGARNPQSVMYCRIQKLGTLAFPPTPTTAPVAGVARPVGPVAGGRPQPPQRPALPEITEQPVSTGDTKADVENFIALYRLDDRAAGVLRDLAGKDPQAADEVMQQPITQEVRNPSGVIHARVTSRTGTSKRVGRSVSARVSPY